jgi:hypothetical protein
MTIGILFLTQTVSMHLSVTEPPKGAARSRRGFVPLAAALAAVSLASRSACASPRPRSLDDGDPGRNQSDKKCLHDAKWGREVRWIASAREVLKSQRDARNSAPPVGTSPVFICPIHIGGILPVGEVSCSCNRKRVEASCRGSPVMSIDPDRARLKSLCLPRGLAITTYLLDARRCGGQFRRSSRQT